jgi:hypothetical protein
LKVYYFYKEENRQETNIVEIAVEPTGRRNTRHLRQQGIEGFFDQANKDLDIILTTPKPGYTSN